LKSTKIYLLYQNVPKKLLLDEIRAFLNMMNDIPHKNKKVLDRISLKKYYDLYRCEVSKNRRCEDLINNENYRKRKERIEGIVVFN